MQDKSGGHSEIQEIQEIQQNHRRHKETDLHSGDSKDINWTDRT